MSKALVVAKKEFATVFKDKVFLIMVILFLVMSVASVYIGSTTKNAELRAYESIVEAARAQGDTIPAAPQIFPLAILRNIIQYIVMIGAVLAIFLGFDAFSGERDGGTLSIILTKPISKASLLTGKLVGAGLVIGLLLAATFIFNLSLFIVFTGLLPNANEVCRLAVFMITALLYMMSFYVGALFVSIKSRDRSYGFLIMMVIWIFVSFVVPQLADTQRSFVYALNNIAETVTQIPSDTPVSRLIDLFSPAVQFQHIGNDLLQTVAESAAIGIGPIIIKDLAEFSYIIISGAVLLVLSVTAAQKEDALC